MAQSHLICLSSYMLYLTMFFTLSFTYIKANPNLIPEICAKTINSSQCNQVLGSTSGASTSDLKGLGYISINISLSNAKQTSQYIESLFAKATDEMLKTSYGVCVESYSFTIDALEKSKKCLDNGDIPSLQTFISTALIDGPIVCDDNFEEQSPAPAQLTDANKKLKGLINILLEIGARLGKSN